MAVDEPVAIEPVAIEPVAIEPVAVEPVAVEPVVESVNVGVERAVSTKSGTTGIDKVPTDHPVAVSVPGPGASGLAGDSICDKKHHGGVEQAVYAYAREDLDDWEALIGRRLRCGVFGENLTTRHLEVTGARLGEVWRVGPDLVLQVTVPRIPCATFAVWMDRQGWLKTFTARAVPGAYLRVLEPGLVRAGDPVVVESRPEHDVTIATVFRALTRERERLPELLQADGYLTDNLRRAIAEG